MPRGRSVFHLFNINGIDFSIYPTLVFDQIVLRNNSCGNVKYLKCLCLCKINISLYPCISLGVQIFGFASITYFYSLSAVIKYLINKPPMCACMKNGAEVYISSYIFRDLIKTKRWYKNVYVSQLTG